ncbi:MAG TPA: Rieske (2Fe-2S) protein [Tangfeifania sp.]|nr:Rieske (2Fe-2S) protein [Tangfeifania sp.]
MERKDFLQKFAIGGSILLTAPVLLNSCSDGTDDAMDDVDNGNDDDAVTIDLTSDDFSDLGTVGGYAYSGNIIIIRSGSDSYLAFSKICTHQQCTVTYNASENELPCPCHGSVFSTSGAVLEGPATSSLKKYSVNKEGDTLKIS